MSKEKMWVCSACGGFYHPATALAIGKCPGCSGSGAVKEVERDESGVLHLSK